MLKSEVYTVSVALTGCMGHRETCPQG